jgi:hypothetical protein
MNKHLLRLIYLARQTEPTNVTTANVHRFINKIPCDQDEFFSAKPAELYVIRELQEYPIDLELPESEDRNENLDLFNSPRMTSIFRKVEEFATDLNYLPIQ